MKKQRIKKYAPKEIRDEFKLSLLEKRLNINFNRELEPKTEAIDNGDVEVVNGENDYE